MAKATLRDMAVSIVPPWLQDDVGNAILRSCGMVLDALVARTVEGVKLRFPEVTTYTAFGYIGNDRRIERGPGQTNAGYSAQLLNAIPTWKNAGAGRTILSQMRAYFAPDDGPPMRLVMDGTTARDFNLWHVVDPTTGYVTRSKISPATWKWGLNRRWYGWAIIDVSGIWVLDYWGDPGDWGDGGVWGSNATQEFVASLNAILKKWSPEGEVAQIIFAFDADTFSRLNTLGDHPNGTGYLYSWQALQEANFLEQQLT
jgi:hypothetical protein